MLRVKRDNWWVRWVLAVAPDTWATPDRLRYGRPVSLCALFWSGVIPPLFLLMMGTTLLSLIVLGVIEIIDNARVKEFVTAVVGAGALIGALIWRGHTTEKSGQPFLPSTVETVFWGIKHRVCPLVKVEDE